MRVHSNIAEFPSRRLLKQWNGAGVFVPAGSTKAIDITAPTTRAMSMGLAGKNGLVSITSLDGGNQVYTIYEWHSGIAALNAGNGWVRNGANSAEYTKTCDQLAHISFTITEGVEFFIQVAATPVTECFVSGSEDPANKNTDLTLKQYGGR